MILTCPSCETQYFADDSTIGESGRTVKCATCGHSWFVRPEGVAGHEHAAAPAAHEIYRERVREQRRRKSRFAALLSWIVTAAVFFTLGLAAIIFRNDVVKFWPESATAYKRAGFFGQPVRPRVREYRAQPHLQRHDSGRHRIRQGRERGPQHRRDARRARQPDGRARQAGRPEIRHHHARRTRRRRHRHVQDRA